MNERLTNLPPHLLKRFLKKVSRDVAVKELKSFRSTVKTWDTDVQFYITEFTLNDLDGYAVETDSDVWRYVNYGTPPHEIPVVDAAWLRFQKGYTAKTRVGYIGSRDGGKWGAWTKRKFVNHQGVEARNFDELIADKSEKRFNDSVDKLLDKFLGK